jgi:hypothetical protein
MPNLRNFGAARPKRHDKDGERTVFVQVGERNVMTSLIAARADRVRGIGCLRLGLGTFLILLLAACSPPPELDRPLASATASALSLLPPGRATTVGLPGTDDAAAIVTADGGRVTALRFASAGAAQDGFTDFEQRLARRSDIGSRSAVSMGATRYLKYSGGQTSGLAWLSGVWVFSVEAASPERVAALIAASGVGGIPAASAGSLGAGAWIGIGIGILGVLLALFLPVLMLRRLAVAPVPGAAVVTRDELVLRLLALNDEGLPYIVRTGPEADLVVEWKFADAAWWGVLAKQGMRKAYRLRLYFDESSHRASALDEFGEVEWSAGLTTAPAMHFQKTFFRGVVLTRRERGVAYGFKTPTGGGAGKVLDYTLDVGWLKQRVTGVIVGSGWRYQPVLWAPRRARPKP